MLLNETPKINGLMVNFMDESFQQYSLIQDFEANFQSASKS